ncbi:hypothetical protein [Streptomyces sp. IBSNAI001]|uniref:hypothetical protein n=1 Tax=Streptomyces sp. IBSNAI001 TaxID=3457499 RepID=UPI003FD1B319
MTTLITDARTTAQAGSSQAGNRRCRDCDTWNGIEDTRCLCCDTLLSKAPAPGDAVPGVGSSEAAFDPMVGYITEAVTAWWSYLNWLAPEFCRERFTTEFARGLVQDVYAHEVEDGSTEADAVAAAGVLLVRNTIAAVSDEQAEQLAAGLRDHVRRSVAQG